MQMFTDAIKPLPKYRVTEIQKKVSELSGPTEQTVPTEQQTMSKTMHDNVMAKPSIQPIQEEESTNEQDGSESQ